ncbi:MAG: hypothetical protein AMXMBFR84_05670 [Candidatus Hydrogenedentota bacterium]
MPVGFALRFLAACVALSVSASALIMVGGDNPMEDPGWPMGALEIANLESRFRYIEGPPFGGGEYMLEYRGGTDELNEALELFGAIRAPGLTVELVDEVGRGAATNADEAVSVDWRVTIWVPRNFHFLYNNPRQRFDLDSVTRRQPYPPTVMKVFLGDGTPIVWKDVHVPSTVEVVDKRAASRDHAKELGRVVSGSVYECATGKPVSGAHVTVCRYAGDRSVKAGPESKADALGAFSIAQIPEGGFFLEVKADGYVTRKVPLYDSGASNFENLVLYLAQPVALEGLVVDSSGKPVAGKDVHVMVRTGLDAEPYESVEESRPKAVTGEDGRYRIENLPEGYVSVVCGGASDWLQTESSDGREHGWVMEPDNRLVYIDRPKSEE